MVQLPDVSQEAQQSEQLDKIAQYTAASQGKPVSIRVPNARNIKEYQKGLKTTIDLNESNLTPDFFIRVLNELKSRQQVSALLDGIGPGAIGTEELVLLLIWTKPLIPPQSGPDA